MSVFLERVSPFDFGNDELSFEFISWASILIDTLNETIGLIEDRLNQPQLKAFTQAEIITASADAPDGSIWYCSDHIPPVYVGKISGALVQFTTSPFP